MTEIITTYQFADSEGDWTAYPEGGSTAVLSWHFRGDKALAPLATYGGCLWSRNSQGSGATANYWLLTKTWEQLGVPSGNTVTRVKADYSYRFTVRSRHNSVAGMSAGDAKSGPFELVDSVDDMIGTFSTAIDCISRTASASDWESYPQDPNYPYTPETDTGQIVEAPASWGRSEGSYINISGANALSTATVKFKLNNILPSCGYHEPRQPSTFLKIKQDRITLTIEHTSSVPTVTGISSITGITTITF